jgi:hypothetical protein
VCASRIRTTHHVQSDRVIVVGTAIELEPEDIRRQFCDLLNGRPSHKSEHIRHPRPLSRIREQEVSPRQHDRRPAHGRDPERCRIATAEQFHLDRRQTRCHPIARHDLDRVERRPVASNAVVSPRAAVHIFESETRRMAARIFAQMHNRGKATV